MKCKKLSGNEHGQGEAGAITVVSEDLVWLYLSSDHGMGWGNFAAAYFEWMGFRKQWRRVGRHLRSGPTIRF